MQGSHCPDYPDRTAIRESNLILRDSPSCTEFSISRHRTRVIESVRVARANELPLDNQRIEKDKEMTI
jgi:hypothetical protein